MSSRALVPWAYRSGTLRAATSPTRESVVEAYAALRIGHFADRARDARPHCGDLECGDCESSTAERHACTRCTHGHHVPQSAHDGPRVCVRHMRWVGPGTAPADQFTVDAATVRADRTYRRLRRDGRIDAVRLAELLACVEVWSVASGEPLDPAYHFRLAVDLARGIASSRRLTSDDAEATERFAALEDIVSGTVECSNANVLVDAAWLLLRADNYAASTNPHSFRSNETVAGKPDDLSLLSSSFYPRVRHLQLAQMVRPSAPGHRFAQADYLDRENDYVCPKGHQFTSTGRLLLASKASGGCGICARKRVSPETSLSATHPHYAAQWHPTKNGAIGPEEVLAGTGDPYFWLCASGHTFKTSPNARTTSGVGCGYCANKLVDETNSLRTTHLSLAAELNDALNGGITADHVVAGSEVTLAWTCTDGHDYWTTPEHRTNGSQCHVCTRQVVHPTTCLAATHPEVAAMWHETLNGNLTPWDVFAGSMDKAWFKCENGHAYDGAIVSRVRGVGCRYCSNRAVWKGNCMRATHPQLAAEFHPTKNGERTPDNLVAGTSHRLWWLCTEGHDWEVSGDNRVRQRTGCPYCSNKKVWVGFNDMATTWRDLAAEFHPTLNGDLTPQDVVAGTAKRLFWECSSGHVWPATGDSRVNKGTGCRDCARAQM